MIPDNPRITLIDDQVNVLLFSDDIVTFQQSTNNTTACHENAFNKIKEEDPSYYIPMATTTTATTSTMMMMMMMSAQKHSKENRICLAKNVCGTDVMNEDNTDDLSIPSSSSSSSSSEIDDNSDDENEHDNSFHLGTYLLNSCCKRHYFLVHQQFHFLILKFTMIPSMDTNHNNNYKNR